MVHVKLGLFSTANGLWLLFLLRSIKVGTDSKKTGPGAEGILSHTL